MGNRFYLFRSRRSGLKSWAAAGLWTLMAFFLVCCWPQTQAIQARQKQNQDNPISLLIPLYSYPNVNAGKDFVWQPIIEAAAKIPITVIINPDNGPGKTLNSDYQQGIAALQEAGVTVIGYTYTKYTERSISEVKDDINVYRSFNKVDGLFLDEAATAHQKWSYYRRLFHYSKPRFSPVILNPGTLTDEKYLSNLVGDTVVVFEDYGSRWGQFVVPGYHRNYTADHFAALIHSVPPDLDVRPFIQGAIARNIHYLYITDDSPDTDGNPWDRLPTQWPELVEAIAALSPPR